jgi:hypothetical protein
MGRKKVQSSLSEVALLERMNIEQGCSEVKIRLNMARGFKRIGQKTFEQNNG